MNKFRWIFAFALVLCIGPAAFPSLAQQNELEQANELGRQVVLYYKQGKYKEAIPLALEVLSILEKARGAEHADVAVALYNLAELYRNMGDYAKAEPLYKRALAIREKTLGPKHPHTAQSLGSLAMLYKSMGDYTLAEPLFKRSLAINEKALGPEHPGTATDLNDLALLYWKKGDYARAEPLFKRSLAVFEKALGPEHPNTASALNSLASLYDSMGDHARAEPMFKRSLAIREKTLGPEHPNTATSLNNLASLYWNMGDHARAEPLFKRALAIREKAQGPDHPSTTNSLGSLAVLYKSMGDYTRAEPLFKRVLAVREKKLGPDHPHTGTSLNNLASLYSSMGDYARAEPLFKRALAIREKALGPDHPGTTRNLNDLAALYWKMGDYTHAEPLFKRALAVNEKKLGQDHPSTAAYLNNLAVLYWKMGDYARAEPLYKRALAIREKSLGPEHPRTGTSLNNLALLYKSMGDHTRAESMYQRALAIREKALGPEHPDTAQSLSSLASLYDSKGDYARAEPLYKRALAIFEKSFGPEHPHTGTSLNNLAGVVAAKGNYAAAHDMQMNAQKISAKLIDQVMGFTSEDQKLKFLATQKRDFEDALSLVAFHMSKDKNAVREMLDVWLARKGVVLEAQRRYQEALVYSDNPEAARVFQELAVVRAALSKLMFGGPGKEGAEAYRKKIATLEAREKKLEARLSKLSQAFVRQKKVKRADTGKVARALPRGSVLVDFIKIEPVDFQAKVKEKRLGPACYLAFVLHAGKGDRVSLVDLGEAAPIDKAVAELKAAMTDLKAKEAMAAGEKLYDMVFVKLNTALGPAKDIFISPDGNLNLIPFEVLRSPDGKYLIEEFSFNYLASGRDMIGYGMFRTNAGPPLIMGDPDFNAAAPETTRTAAYTRSMDMRGFRFGRLPGTRDEVKAVRQILGNGTLYTGKEAVEDMLFKARSPRILHLATHGFFLTDKQMGAMRAAAGPRDASPKEPAVRVENPLLRSGLALAGANRALASNDADRSVGLLTAEKVLSLRLQGTELVVLSACETGAGQVQTGEGVYGLRRAFTQAGADGLIMSMWPVPDRETKELMIHFYGNLKKGMSPRQALRTAALTEMEIVRDRHGHTHPLYWGAFVYMGEPGKSTYKGGQVKQHMTEKSTTNTGKRQAEPDPPESMGRDAELKQRACFIESSME